MPNEVKVRTYSWEQLVQKAEGEELNKPDVVYEFSNSRKFEDSGEAFYVE